MSHAWTPSCSYSYTKSTYPKASHHNRDVLLKYIMQQQGFPTDSETGIFFVRTAA